jgi:hypothetical protein
MTTLDDGCWKGDYTDQMKDYAFTVTVIRLRIEKIENGLG